MKPLPDHFRVVHQGNTNNTEGKYTLGSDYNEFCYNEKFFCIILLIVSGTQCTKKSARYNESGVIS